MSYKFHEKSSPLRAGNEPEDGDFYYPLHIPTEEGMLTIVFGRDGFVKLAGLLICMMCEDSKFLEDAKSFADEVLTSFEEEHRQPQQPPANSP